jgi:oligopeptidase A
MQRDITRKFNTNDDFCRKIVHAQDRYSFLLHSYKWAEVMSADAFSAFEEVGLDNEDEVKRVGQLFRDTVLSLGGGVPPMEVFERFRGRQPSPEALLRHNGLT